MRKKIGEYDSTLKKLYGSLRKRYGLAFDETLDELEEIFSDEEYGQLPVFLLNSDDTYSRDFINEINAVGRALAYGFYRDGDFPYKVITEVREAIPKLLRQSDEDKFFYISIRKASPFVVERSGIICLKIEEQSGNLVLNIIKNRRTIQDEIIREYRDDEDKNMFIPLVSKFYYSRWEKRPDIFLRRYSPSSRKNNNVIVCLKKGEIVGFLIYGYGADIAPVAMRDEITVTVWDVFVKERYRRQGIATRMYEKLVKNAEYCRAKKIRFKVWEEDVETNLFLCSLQCRELYSLYELDVK